MESKAPNRSAQQFNEYENFSFHPHNVLLALVLFGLSTLFLSMTIAFVYSRVQSDLPPIKLPNIFYFNTLILVASSGTMLWAKRSYQEDNTRNYQMALASTILLSFFFMGMQYVGWNQLIGQDIFINTDNSAGYLYVISGLHFAHVIAGIPFLLVFLFVARKRMKEPVSVLVYFSDPEKRLKLRLLTIYWHFLDALWIYLVLFFLVNYLVR
ncbi:MAG: cytochrome c oxidase subunit 3 [Saprospiraceae bacterium]|nr:cytochrome c oxidase subunit 3 [Saprospiraceae bacterium]